MSTRIGKHRLRGMKLDFVSLVHAGDDPMAQVVIAKAEPDDAGDNMPEPVKKDDLDPTVVAYIESLESDNEDLVSKVTKAEEERDAAVKEVEARDAKIAKMVPKDDDAAAEISKADLEALPPGVRAVVEAQQERLAKSERIAKEEREARLGAEYISKAESLPMLSEDKGDLAGLLRRMADALTPEDVTKMETILKAANQQIASSNLYSTLGSGGAETTVSKSVESQAQEIVKNDPTLTLDQAKAKVYEQNPALFAQAMTGQEG